MKKYLLILALISTNLMAQNHLTLYFIPSPKGMDWSTPSNLAMSALKNKITFAPHFIGHVFVELQCGEKQELTGMTSKTFDYLTQLLVYQRGLGILYHSFEGKLESKDSVGGELSEYFKNGGMNFTRFLLNEGHCKRLTEYLKVYREKDVGRYYGLSNRPRFGEGAGCSAFGVSFVDVAGFLETDIKDAWSSTVNIPLEFSGPPLKDEGVGLIKLLMNAGRWATEKEAHQKLSYWDPDKMYRWTNEKLDKKLPGYNILSQGRVQGIVIDKQYLPAPQGPIWLQHTEPQNLQTAAEK